MGETMETRVLPMDHAEMRVHEEDGSNRLEGRAIPFNSESRDLGGFTEVFRPGAFDAALEGSDVIATFNHDRSRLLGSERGGTLRLRQTERGLEYSVDLPDTATAREVHTLVQRGDLTGSSITFDVPPGGDEVRAQEDGSLLRVVHEVAEVGDVGPVSEPAYEMTEVSARSLEEARDELEREPGPVSDDEMYRDDQFWG